jgi:hypothetical protein
MSVSPLPCDDLGQAAVLHVPEDLIHCHPVGVRRLEDPLLDRVDDDAGTGQRDEGHARFLDQLDDGHGRTGGRAADDEVDLVLLEQALDGGHGLLGVVLGVVVDQLQRPAEHAARRVDLLHVHLQGLELGIAQERGRAGHRQERADLDRLGGLNAAKAKAGGPDDNGCYCGYLPNSPNAALDHLSTFLFKDWFYLVEYP